VIAGQPFEVQFHRVIWLLDAQIPADSCCCVQLGLE
jgi:hypothetical protein